MPNSQVDFYLIANQVSDAKYKFASRLANKLQRLKQKTLLVVADPQSFQTLDKIMWSYSDTSFVAHENASEASIDTIVHLAVPAQIDDKLLHNKYKVVINLTDSVLDRCTQVERIAEIVEHSETAKSSARERFRVYQAQDYAIKTHNIEL